MPSIEKHLEASLIRTGNEHRNVHEWLDGDPEKAAERHDITRIYEYGKMFEQEHGSEALAEYIEHIREDVVGKLRGLGRDEKTMLEALAYFGCVPG